MRLLTLKYENIVNKVGSFQSEFATDADVAAFRELIKKMSWEENYEPVPGKKEGLDAFIKKVVEFSRAYEVDTIIDDSSFGIEVKLCFNDCAMPEEMTAMFGKLVAMSDKMYIWTKLRNQEYDCIFSLDYCTHRLKR